MSMQKLLQFILILLIGISLGACASNSNSTLPSNSNAEIEEHHLDHDFLDDDFYDDEEELETSDPLEAWNRFWFGFNDEFHSWVLNPVATTYDAVLPDDIQMVIFNVFHNISTPVRLVSSILQGDIENAGIELERFVINSTLGVFGFGDPAGIEFNITTEDDEDIGQVLASWGIGEGCYIVLPFLGPSTVRDSFGLVGDAFLKPTTYIGDFSTSLSVEGGYYVKREAIHLGEYDDIVKATVDPYVSIRDMYMQYREGKQNK